MQIAVTTPSGNVGSHVVSMLVRAGARPRVLSRTPGHLDPGLDGLVDVVEVDQRNIDQVVAATTGVDSLFWVDPTADGEDPLAEYGRATQAVVAAVERNHVERVVFLSSVGAELRHGAGEIDGLAATELALDATAAAVTHLRCGFFFTNLLLDIEAIRGGSVSVILPLDAPLAWVAPRDIAELAVGRLLDPGWTGRHVRAVHGPEDLTWAQAAAIVSDATGHAFVVERIADDEMRERLRSNGMTAGLVEAVVGMSIGMRDGFVPEQPRTTATTTPTRLGGWAYDVLRPLLAA